MKARSNTAVPDSILHDTVILCCGEDPAELMSVLPVPERPAITHEHRCYRFWRFETFLLAWTGIGTGCLEPMLYEILTARSASVRPLIQRIVLVGTAGGFRKTRTPLGRTYLLDPAYLGASAIATPVYQITSAHRLPLHPRLGDLEKAASTLERRTVVSTDFYYGFSHSAASAVIRKSDRRLADAVDAASKTADLLEMETAQFYYFCELLGDSALAYAAIKGCSNYIEDFTIQNLNTARVLRTALANALDLLGIARIRDTLDP